MNTKPKPNEWRINTTKCNVLLSLFLLAFLPLLLLLLSCYLYPLTLRRKLRHLALSRVLRFRQCLSLLDPFPYRLPCIIHRWHIFCVWRREEPKAKGGANSGIAEGGGLAGHVEDVGEDMEKNTLGAPCVSGQGWWRRDIRLTAGRL